VLVLDDYHLIHAPAIHDALTFLVEHSPPQLHVLLTSRVDPPLPLAAWRARGQLAEVRAVDLRFTSVDEGPLLAALLRAVGRRSSASHLRPYLSRLLAPFAEPQPTAPPGPVAAPARLPATPLLEPLTEREQAVLKLVAEGASNEQIATTLVISIHTVRKHVGNILAKLAVASRTEAAARARRLGLL